ncbi:hypothetical protein AB6724_18585 [Comamonas guangdongensis]|uniref:Uncharacterized protein n=1 Tax=Comamonas guangdongensis TaxID=510515 RepID=A0ABV3ZZ13_9BURK
MHKSLAAIELIFGTIYRIFTDLSLNLFKSIIYPIAIQVWPLFGRNAASEPDGKYTSTTPQSYRD